VPEIVLLSKVGGPLTKEIRLEKSGDLKSDGSACVMSRGVAHRAPISCIGQLGALIGGLQSNQAIALGSLRHGLPQQVQIATQRAIRGATGPNIISRTADNITYRPGQTGFALLDCDTKGMPPAVAERIAQAGGFWPALISVIPKLGSIAHIARASTSAGLYRKDTGATVPGSNGVHVYVAIQDVADSPRFLKSLHDRCWLAGYAWVIVGAGGQLLDRSIVDRMVGAPERLAFEGSPILIDPLAQSAEARRPQVREGGWLDTLAACPPLSIVDKAKLAALRNKAKHALAGETAKARQEFIGEQAEELAKRTGMSHRFATEAIRKQCGGILLPSIVLPFDDPELKSKTVANVLADPAEFEGETLADPLEGVEYGRCKARIMRHADGTPWINSFAHGRTTYELKHDAAAVRAAMASADVGEVVSVLVDMLLQAAVEPAEQEAFLAYAKERTGTGARTISRQIKNARQARAKEEAKEARERRMAERDDPRPMLPAPAPDAPWLPEMAAYNEVLGKSKDRIPPARNMDGDLACVRRVEIAGTHAFVSANEGSDTTGKPPPQCVITVMSEAAAAELIERHIDFVDGQGRSVHCPSPFVRHYLRRDDAALPSVVAVATLPIVSADGCLIHTDGLDRDRGIVFDVEPGLMELIPPRKDCDDRAVGEAMQFLLHDWLGDVAADHAGKCSLVALALTIVERSLLDQRPAWFVTAGQRGSGKTTSISMMIKAATGTAAAASAWSPNEEERRKALLSYLMSGVPYILWDNITRGTQISCAHIEKSCTASFYADRKLGVSEMVMTAAASVHVFTGNNVGPKGDLASRSLQVRLEVERIDPENRDFRHPDPIDWTAAHRAEILQALYTILLGNPALDLPRDAPMKTRFKLWYRLVGAAIEHAAKCAVALDPDVDHLPEQTLDFATLFLDQEGEEEDATSLAEMLCALSKMMTSRDLSAGRRPEPFKASDVAEVINATPGDADALVLKSFLFPTLPTSASVTAKAVGKRLKAHVDETVRHGAKALTLKARMDTHAGATVFSVSTIG
jgi:hypothetical protein